MKFQPFVFWLIALIIGILLQITFEFSFYQLTIATTIAVCFLIFFNFKNKYKCWFSICGLVVLILVGALRFENNHRTIKSLPQKKFQSELVHFSIKEKLKPSEKYLKYLAQANWTKNDSFLNQKFLVYVRKSQEELLVGDSFWTYGKYSRIEKAKNPHQFDYKSYMSLKNVGLQIFCDSIVGIEHPQGFSPNYLISKFKTRIKQQLVDKRFSKEARVFISALALGDRAELDRDYQEKLSSAGVMHLFAISGLHVGIIFGFLLILFYPILYLKHGRYIRYWIALILIWLYAWFVGFSPSVTRAAFMLSLYFITIMLQRPANIFHTLAVTAFVVLIVSPKQLFDVGFQLSYTAVFFIAWLFPVMRKFLPKFRKPYKNYPFDILTVTTTAQIGVMPISVFYFNKFSGLFLLGNIVLLPIAGLLVIVSIFSIGLLHLGWMPQNLVNGLNFVFEYIFKYLDWITSFESFIFRDISWNWMQVFILLTILIWLKFVFTSFKFYKLIPIFGLFLLFQLTVIWDKTKFENKTELIVFQEYKGSIIGLREGLSLNVFMQVEDSAKTMQYTLLPYAMQEKIKNLQIHDLPDHFESNHFLKTGNVIKFDNKMIGIAQGEIDSIEGLEYIILRKSKPKIQITKSVKKLIADGSNYPNVIENLGNDSLEIHYTKEDGAFILEVDKKTK